MKQGIQELESRYLRNIAESSLIIPSEETNNNKSSVIDVYFPLQVLPTIWKSTTQTGQDVIKSAETLEGTFSLPLTRVLQEWRILLLSEPGAGKSITLKFIAYCFASKEEGLAEKKLGLYEDRVPILLSLRDVTEGIEEADLKKTWLDQWLADAILNVIEADLSDAKSLIKEWKNAGRLFVLLDGLDEVPERLRGEISKKIEHFMDEQQNRRCHVLVTSRKEGYKRLNADILREYELLPLVNSEDIYEFITRWICSLRPEYSKQEVGEKAFHLLEHITAYPYLNQMGQNPLFLRLIVSLYINGRELPENKNQLLWKYIEDTWERRTRKQKGLPFNFMDALRALEVLAWEIHTHGERNLRKLSQLIQKEVPNIRDGKKLIQFLRMSMGLLVYKDDNFQETIDFWHSIFRIYFVTLYLKSAWEKDSSQVWLFLSPRLHHQEWKGSIELLAGEFEEERSTELVRSILNNNSNYEKELLRDLLLAGECLANGALLDNEVRSGLLERLVHYYLDESIYDVNYENPIIHRLIIRPLELILGSCTGESRDFITNKLSNISQGFFREKESKLKIRLEEIVHYPKLMFFLIESQLSVAFLIKKIPSLRQVVDMPSRLKEWRSEVEINYRSAAIKAIGRLRLDQQDLNPILTDLLGNVELRAASAETLGKVGTGEIYIAKAILDTIQNHRYQNGWDCSVERMIKALGLLAQRHSNIVESFLEMINTPQPVVPPGDIHYILTLVLHKAAETNPKAMAFIVEAWRRFPNDNVDPNKEILVEFTEDIREGLKDCSKFTPLEFVSPEVLEYLLAEEHQKDQSPYIHNVKGVMVTLVGDSPLVRCKVLGPNGTFFFKSVDITEEIIRNFLYRLPTDIYGDVGLTLIFRWAKKNPNFAIHLLKTIQDADNWIMAKLIEEKIQFSTDEKIGPQIQHALEELRSVNVDIREQALKYLQDNLTDPLSKLIEYRKWTLLSNFYSLIVYSKQEYDPTMNINHQPVAFPDPYFISAIACFRSENWKNPFLIPQMNGDVLRERNQNAIEKAILILKNHSSLAIEALSPIVSVDWATEEPRKSYQMTDEQIVVAHTLARLSYDHPEAQRILLNMVPSYSKWDEIEKDVLYHLILALGHVNSASSDVVRILFEAIKSKDYEISFAGYYSLRHLDHPSPEALDLLVQTYNKINNGMREDLLEAIGRSEPSSDEVLNLLCQVLKDKNINIRSIAAKHLGNFRVINEKVINDLISSLRNNYQAAEALGKVVLRELPIKNKKGRKKLEKISIILKKILDRERFFSYHIRQDGPTLVFEALHQIADQIIEIEVNALHSDLAIRNQAYLNLGRTNRKIKLVLGILLTSILSIASNLVATYLQEKYQLISNSTRLILVWLIFFLSLFLSILFVISDNNNHSHL